MSDATISGDTNMETNSAHVFGIAPRSRLQKMGPVTGVPLADVPSERAKKRSL